LTGVVAKNTEEKKQLCNPQFETLNEGATASWQCTYVKSITACTAVLYVQVVVIA